MDEFEKLEIACSQPQTTANRQPGRQTNKPQQVKKLFDSDSEGSDHSQGQVLDPRSNQGQVVDPRSNIVKKMFYPAEEKQIKEAK